MYRRINDLLGTNFESNKEINWRSISKNYKLSEDFIREFKDYVDWTLVSRFQTLSENFIRDFESYVNWFFISDFQILSEEFIEEFKDTVRWDCISSSQLLKENFILKYEDKINWQLLSLTQPFLTNNIINHKKINKSYLKGPNTSYQLYQQTKNRGWFVGYVNKTNSNLYQVEDRLSMKYNIKAKIYWKDIKLTDRVDKFELIREVKYV